MKPKINNNIICILGVYCIAMILNTNTSWHNVVGSTCDYLKREKGLDITVYEYDSAENVYLSVTNVIPHEPYWILLDKTHEGFINEADANRDNGREINDFIAELSACESRLDIVKYLNENCESEIADILKEYESLHERETYLDSMDDVYKRLTHLKHIQLKATKITFQSKELTDEMEYWQQVLIDDSIQRIIMSAQRFVIGYDEPYAIEDLNRSDKERNEPLTKKDIIEIVSLILMKTIEGTYIDRNIEWRHLDEYDDVIYLTPNVCDIFNEDYHVDGYKIVNDDFVDKIFEHGKGKFGRHMTITYNIDGADYTYNPNKNYHTKESLDEDDLADIERYTRFVKGKYC